MGLIRKLKSKHKNRGEALASPVQLHLDDGLHCTCRSISLATGSFSAWGVVSLSVTPRTGSYGSGSFSDYDEHCSAATKLTPIEESPASLGSSQIFIRTADLHVEPASISDLADDKLVEYAHTPSPNPPLPSINFDPNERWVALDDGNGNKAPLTNETIAVLLKTALEASLTKNMWTPNGGTIKLLKSNLWEETIYRPYTDGVPAPHARGSKRESDVLVWSGEWDHVHRGHDLPAIRCEAMINMSPKSLADLLMDSTRIKEYNKMSLGREDILVLSNSETCITKIVRAKARPPMLGKTMVLTNLLHMQELPGGGKRAGYAIVSRAIVHADDAEVMGDPKVVQSEMLMGLNVLRVVDGEPDRCVMINLNHLMSPMIPAMLSKRLGLTAAVNFINDIRSLV